MADDTTDDMLRQMAEHRGLKLVKSRRRKAGVGDYGKFGLTDASGKALLGIGQDGLTASAEDIESYLRGDALGTWKQSAVAAPERPKPPPPEDQEHSKPVDTPPQAERSVKRRKPSTPAAPVPRPVAEKVEKRQAAPQAAVVPVPEPELTLRAARPSDASVIAKMLGHLSGITIDGDMARQNLAAAQKAGCGFLLAEFGEPIGCCGWAVVQTVHRGAIGRITMLFVDKDHRRRGIATRLLAEAEQALVAEGCAIVEVMSDIQIDNAHSFFRSLKFEQASYRFVREIGGGG